MMSHICNMWGDILKNCYQFWGICSLLQEKGQSLHFRFVLVQNLSTGGNIKQCTYKSWNVLWRYSICLSLAVILQVENEYGNTKEKNRTTDKEYLRQIKKIFEKAELVELFFTSDTPSKGKQYGAIEDGMNWVATALFFFLETCFNLKNKPKI